MSNDKVTSGQDPEVLIKGILQEAQDKIAVIERDALEYSQRIIASAESQARTILDRAQKDAQERALEIKKNAEAKAAIEASKSDLDFKARIMEHIMQKAKESLQEIRKENSYYDILLSWACECVLGVGTDEVILEAGELEKKLLSPDFMTALDKKVKAIANKKISVNLAPGVLKEDGIRAQSPDGHIIFDNTFNARFARKKPVLYEALYVELDEKLK